MSERKIALALGEFYHVYNRGNSKQNIFRDSGDYARFQQMLYAMNATESVTFRLIEEEKMYTYDRGNLLVYIGAYCLMPNHFHLLLTPAVEGGIQTFVQKLSTGYSMYFNKKHERTGGLFEGRFKAQHANTDEYLKYLFSYIHLNPVKLIQSDWKESGIQDLAKTKQYLDEYKYSSLQDYLGSRTESAIINRDKFPPYFTEKQEIDAELIEWLNYNRELLPRT